MDFEGSKISRREAIGRILGGSLTGLLVMGGFSSCAKSKSDSADASALVPGMKKEGGDRSSLHIPCIGCGACMPCPYGVDIPGCFDVWNDAVDNHDLPDPSFKGTPEYQTLSRRFLTDYHNRIPTLSRADHCIGCGKCIPKCSQHIQIPVFLRQIEWVEERSRLKE